VLNANAMLGPWSNSTSRRPQAEWTRQEGFASGRTFVQATDFDSNTDRSATDETFGLRYAGIPATVLFVETRFQQETYSQFEEGFTDEVQEFLRDTDAEGDLKDYQAGFTVAPWRTVSFEAKYRHRDRQNSTTPAGIDLLYNGNGYPLSSGRATTRGRDRGPAGGQAVALAQDDSEILDRRHRLPHRDRGLGPEVHRRR
jgi:hypothetical protein